MIIRYQIFLILLNYFCITFKSTKSENEFKVSRKLCEPEEFKFCDKSSKYRSYNGRCNNLENPEFGAMGTPQPRLWPSVYDDKLSHPRTTSKRGFKLPNARKVSASIHTEEPLFIDFSLMLMQWGQLLDHDITIVPKYDDQKCDQCTNYDTSECFPVPIPQDDDFFSGPDAPKCFPLKRSIGIQANSRSPREQVNMLSSHIDASMVYGVDKCFNDKLRDPQAKHILRTQKMLLPLVGSRGLGGVMDMLPMEENIPECRGSDGFCFLAGEVRANEQPSLTALHTVLLRLHNYVASDLYQANTQWTQEKVYQEARRIVGAVVQHVTYSEFLPRVLGDETIKKFSLDLENLGYFKGYNSQCSTSIFNEFSAAAFRFGHSMIKPEMQMLSELDMMGTMGHNVPLGRNKGNKTEFGRKISLRHHFNNPGLLMENPECVEELIRGLLTTPLGEVDRFFTKEITNHLFEEPKKRFSGMDLVAFNIQRGREHGIPGYNVYREVCGLEPLSSMNIKNFDINEETLDKMKKVFDHPDDIDLFTGLMSETKTPGSLVGPTLGCLLGVQFSNLRKCDRFWYETDDPLLRFSPAQLAEIRRVSMASVLCSTSQHRMNMITRSVFDLHDSLTNPLVQCGKDIPLLDLSPWYDNSIDTCPSYPRASVSPCSQCQCTVSGDVCDAKCSDIIKVFGVDAVKNDCSGKCLIDL